jgi:hexosaminidase
MSWRGTQGGIVAATASHDVVLSPTSHCYFDYSYDAIDSRRVHAFDPLAGFPQAARGRVLGIQANFWSHIDREPYLVDRQLFPRLLALAERAWVPEDCRDWEDYHRRAVAQLPRLKQWGIAYHAADLTPVATAPPSR